jgi:hypothetical protein
MAETVFEASSALWYQTKHLRYDTSLILGMDMARPEIRVIAHFALRVPQNLFDVLADEGTLKVARGLGGVDDRRTNSEHVL